MHAQAQQFILCNSNQLFQALVYGAMAQSNSHGLHAESIKSNAPLVRRKRCAKQSNARSVLSATLL